MGGGFLSLRLAGGLVWWNARESYQENRAETNFESVEEIQHFLHMLNSYCTHTASIILNHWKLEFFWNYLQASTQRICVLRSQYCCVLKAIQFGKVAVFYYYFFFTKSCCRNLSVFGAVLVAFFVVVVVSVVCWSSRLTMIMTDKALGMKSSGSWQTASQRASESCESSQWVMRVMRVIMWAVRDRSSKERESIFWRIISNLTFLTFVAWN